MNELQNIGPEKHLLILWLFLCGPPENINSPPKSLFDEHFPCAYQISVDVEVCIREVFTYAVMLYHSNSLS